MTRQLNLVLQFYGTDPILAWAMTLAALFILAAMVMAIIASREEDRQQREAAAFERQLRERPTVYPPPSGKKGFDRNRRRVS
jgi:hypothetical protein